MKGKTRIFKLLLTTVMTLALALVIVACGGGKTDAADVLEAKAALAITYTNSNDNLNSVTADLELPTEGVKGVSITWASSHPSIVSTSGVVTRPVADTVVTLTASLSKGDANDTKKFSVKVLKPEVTVTPQEALNALEITGEDLELEGALYTTSKDIVIPTTSLGYEVNWESSNETVIELDGTVNRPSYGEVNARVILTAFIGALEKEFIVDVLAETVMPVEMVLDKAETALQLPLSEVVENITLPLEITVEGNDGPTELYTTTITWASSHPEYISTTGQVTRPQIEQPDVMVTLTGTITYNGVTRDKEIQIRVLAESEPYETFDTFLEAQTHYLDKISGTSDRVYIKVLNVSLIGRMDDGLMFVDSEGSPFFAFGSQSNAYENAQFDQLYDVLGNFAYYFGVIQINGTGTASSRQPTILFEKEGDPVTVTPTVVESLKEYLPDTMPTYSQTNILEMEYLRLEAKVYVSDPLNNYGVFLVDINYDGDYSDINEDKNFYSDNGLVIYYTSNNQALVPLNGLKVTIDVVLYGLRDDKGIYNAVFLGEVSDIIVHEMTDEQAVNATKSSLESSLPDTVIEAGTINLPTELFGTTIAWASSDTEVIALDGTVTPVEGERVSVELTATITKGDKTATATKTVVVGELPILSVTEALALPLNSVLKVKGTVIGFSANNTLVLHDGEKAIALFISNAPEAVGNTLKGSFGKVVVVEGTRLAHQGLEQVGNIVSAVVVATEQPTVLKQDITDIAWTAEALLPHQSKLISIVGGKVSSVNVDSYGNVLVGITMGEKTIDIKWDSRVALTGGLNILATAVVGDVINVVDAPLSWTSDTPQIGYYVSNQVTLSPDPDLERFEVVFMDGEEEVSTIEVVEGRTILEYPTMSKENATFVGWFKDAALTEEWLVDDVVDGDLVLYAKWDSIEVIEHFKFDVGVYPGNGTGYAASNEFTWNETFGPVTVKKDRVQINKSTFEPHDGEAMLVFSIRDTHHTAWMEFDFTSYTTLSKISFEMSVWNQTHVNAVKNVTNGFFGLQKQVGGAWVNVSSTEGQTDVLSLITVDVYTQVTFDVDGPGLYRIVYNGESTINSNTTTAITVDNLKLYGKPDELENPVDVTFGLGYGDAEPTVITVERGSKVNSIGSPTRAGYEFLGWFIEGDETAFDFDSAVEEDIVLVARWKEVSQITIAEAASKPVGTEVEFVGVVTGFAVWSDKYNNWTKAFLEDESGTIVLHNPALPIDVEVGDVFKVNGVIAHYNGLIQIGQGATYTASTEEIEISEALAITNLDDLVATKQGARINLSGQVVSVTTTGQQMVVKVGTKTITIRSASSEPANAINAKMLTANIGDTVNLTGIHVDWFNGPQLYPLSADQFEFIELTDAQKLQLAEAAIIGYFDEKEFNMGSQINLSEALLHGAEVSYVTDPVNMITAEGKWADVEADTNVDITATLTLGEESLVVEVSVTVKFVDSGAPAEPVTVTATSNNISSNMTAGVNDASVLNLDGSIFTVSVNKGAPSSVVGLYSDLRLYGDRNSGDGNELVIGVVEGKKIIAVEIEFGSSTNEFSSRISLGDQIINLTKTETSGTVTYTGLDISQFMVKNTGIGGTSNPQVRINLIKITYQ